MSNGPSDSLPSAVSPRSLLWLGVSLLVVFVRTFQSIFYPLARDQATFCFIGQRLWEGKRLYLDLWDNKPPGIFYLYAVMVKAFGPVMWSVGLVEILWLLIISIFIFKFAERYLGTAPAVIAVVVHATWRARSGYWDAGQPENFLVLLVIAAYFLSSSRGKIWWVYDGLSGILFGAAFWLKYNAVAFVPLLLVLPYLDFSPLAACARLPRFTLSRREWMNRVRVWAAAFAVSVAVVLVYFAWIGAWPAMKEIQFEVLPRYNAMVMAVNWHQWPYTKQLINLGPGWWSILVAALVLLVAWRTHDLAATLPIYLAALLGALCTAMQTRLPTYAFETCFPFFAMLWGYLGVRVFQGFRRLSRQCWSRGWRLAAVLIWIVFANLVYLPLPDEVLEFKFSVDDLGPWYRNRDNFYRSYPRARTISHYDGQMHVIRYLLEKSTSQDGVFVWGSEPLIYFLAQRNPPTRFVSNLALISAWGPPAWRLELMRDLDATPPKYIVVVREDWVPMISFNYLDSASYLEQRYPALLAFVTSRYQKVDDYREFVIYRHD